MLEVRLEVDRPLLQGRLHRQWATGHRRSRRLTVARPFPRRGFDRPGDGLATASSVKSPSAVPHRAVGRTFRSPLADRTDNPPGKTRCSGCASRVRAYAQCTPYAARSSLSRGSDSAWEGLGRLPVLLPAIPRSRAGACTRVCRWCVAALASQTLRAARYGRRCRLHAPAANAGAGLLDSTSTGGRRHHRTALTTPCSPPHSSPGALLTPRPAPWP